MAVLLAMERLAARRRQVHGSVEDLVRAGESAKVEFKSSARYNRHSGKRDERLEKAVAKTVAGFLNAEGGVLLIGVADDGSVPGIEDDYMLLKAPDRDRFELWLRDMLTKSIGVVATSDGGELSSTPQTGTTSASSPRPPLGGPFFVHGSDGHDATLFVRLGNTTLELDAEESLTYPVHRWARRALRECRVCTGSDRPRARGHRHGAAGGRVHPRWCRRCHTESARCPDPQQLNDRTVPTRPRRLPAHDPGRDL